MVRFPSVELPMPEKSASCPSKASVIPRASKVSQRFVSYVLSNLGMPAQTSTDSGLASRSWSCSPVRESMHDPRETPSLGSRAAKAQFFPS